MSYRSNRPQKKIDPARDSLIVDVAGVTVAVFEVSRSGKVSRVVYVERDSVKPADRERCAALVARFLICDHEEAYRLLFDN
jgi:hypothetical protein